MSTLGALAKLGTEVAEDQWGLVTRAEALDIGVPRATFARLVEAGVLERVAHGVYRVVGGADPGFTDLRAAWLQLDPAVPAWRRRLEDYKVAVVSHRSAAEVYGLGDLIADIHEFTVPARRQTRRDDVRLYVREVPAEDRALVAGLPVTRPHRIVADLLAQFEDGSHVATIAFEAVYRRLTTQAELAAAADRVARRYGFPSGAALVDDLLDLAS